MKFAQVALALPIRESFDYSVPEGLELELGMRVLVPFGRRQLKGVVVGLSDATTIAQVKPIAKALDHASLLSGGMLKFTRWIADYYLAGWGEVLPLALPPEQKAKKERVLLRLAHEASSPASKQAPPLNAAQAAAVQSVVASLKAKQGDAYLLHGVTGSGKTEVYLHALEEALRLGGTAIVLVPEIALTPQSLARFEARFPKEIAVLHSGLSDKERRASFEALRSGKARVALGARSALFAPLQNLSLIIVDEESEPSYKQENAPRYHARDAALVRAKMEGAVALLGSATPSFESYQNARSGKLRLLELPERIGGRPLPKVEFVDLSSEGLGRQGEESLSAPLLEALKKNQERKEQSLLFLNRRGFAPVLACVKCGESIRCPNCSISLTYHKERSRGVLRCHFCGHEALPPTQCPMPSCLSKQLKLLGSGTQRLEEEARRMLPGVRLLRVDRDSASGVDFHESLSRQVHAGELDLLVGTQMIAKGLDFPKLSLVGIVNADAALSFPDFRAEERCFQLLVQVAGRAGRAEHPGKVIVQTRQPEHPCLRAAALQDFKAFFRDRIAERKALGYPPFGRLASILVRSQDKEAALKAAGQLADRLEENLSKFPGDSLSILGPAPAPLLQLKGWWRYRLLIKGARSKDLHELLAPLAFETKASGVHLAVDMDPLNFM